MSTQDLLDRFYAAFAQRDGATMAAAYAPNATFTDPAFPGLTGQEPGAMWQMLTSRSTDLAVDLRECTADAQAGTARWIATYTFAATGNKVVNDVRSTFRFADGLIADQRDDFDFHRWAAQALGLKGKLLGGTPFLRKAVQKQARAGLDAYLASR